jgi:hypothetical protein
MKGESKMCTPVMHFTPRYGDFRPTHVIKNLKIVNIDQA